jgi:hypothetical protein
MADAISFLKQLNKDRCTLNIDPSPIINTRTLTLKDIMKRCDGFALQAARTTSIEEKTSNSKVTFDTGLKVPADIPMSDRKDPEPSWTGTKSNLTNSEPSDKTVIMPTTAAEFKEAVEEVLPKLASSNTKESKNVDKVVDKPDIVTGPHANDTNVTVPAKAGEELIK